MKIALVFTPLKLERNWSTLVFQDKHIGIMPPLSLAYVAAIAEKSGHKVIIIDAVAESLSLDDIIARINHFSPDILGFTITTYGFHQTLSWIKKIKDKVRLPAMVGGWHLSLYPEETMAHEAIDYALIGEAENSLPSFLKAIEMKKPLNDVPGLVYRENSRIVINPVVNFPEHIDRAPFPARHLLKNERYFNILSRIKNFTVMLSARGCPYRCIFCDLKTNKFRMRSAINFIDEVEHNYKEFGIKEFDVYDSTFTVNKERVKLICQEINKRKLKVYWTARTRVDTVDKDLLKEMAGAGCNTIMYGIESGIPEILKVLRKDSDIERIKNTLKWTKHAGIKTLGFFMLGSPGETYKTAIETIRFSTKLELDYVQFTRLTPFPNTEIYQMLMDDGFGDYWREFTLDPSIERELPLVRTNITSKEAMQLVRKAYLYFYFRPSYILKAIKRTKSLLELRNSLRAAIGIFLSKQPEFT